MAASSPLAGPAATGNNNNGGGNGSSNSNGDPRSVRIKMRHDGDARYLMVPARIAFGEFVGRVRDKLGAPPALRIKVLVKDEEGDMITLGDPDDWEMALATARREARRAAEEMGRMEVCFFFSFLFLFPLLLLLLSFSCVC